MKWLIFVISIIFLFIIAALEIWKHLVPTQSQLIKYIEITLVIMAFVGGVASLINLNFV